MEEKVLNIGKVRFSTVKLKIFTFSGSVIFGLITIFFLIMSSISEKTYLKYSLLYDGAKYSSQHDILWDKMISWDHTWMFFREWYFIPLICFGICLIIGSILYINWSKCELTVTNKRVYGKTALGKRVDLPIDSVSAVGTSWLWGIDIGTSSGRIHFKFMKNKDEIHSVLSELLMERQQEKSTAHIQTASNADELKKYKDLLDNRAITQAEFDEKKRQLLDL